jgi:thymidylate kinase
MDIQALSPILDLLETLEQHSLSCIFLRERHFFSVEEEDQDFWCSFEQQDHIITHVLALGWFVIGGRYCQNKQGRSQVIRFKKEGYTQILELWIGDLRADSIIYASAESVLQHQVKKDGLVCLDDELLLSILVLRPILKRRNISKYRPRIDALQVDSLQVEKWLKTCETNFGPSLHGICDSVISGQNRRLGPVALLLIVLKQYSLRGLISLSFIQMGLFAKRLAYRPPLVSFIGTDGSGKSTTAESLVEFVQHQQIKAEYIYAGRSKNNSILVTVARQLIFFLGLAKKISEEEWKTHAIANDKTEKKEAGGVILMLALSVYFFEYHLRYFAFRWQSRFSKVIKILDRGAWDIATIKGLCNLPVYVAKHCPRSDVTFFCYATPTVIQSRKLERSVREIIRQQAIYRFLGRVGQQQFICLDTSRSMEAINQQVRQVFCEIVAQKSGALDKVSTHVLQTIRSAKS